VHRKIERRLKIKLTETEESRKRYERKKRLQKVNKLTRKKVNTDRRKRDNQREGHREGKAVTQIRKNKTKMRRNVRRVNVILGSVAKNTIAVKQQYVLYILSVSVP
jgi:hypothetical protein